MIYHVNSPAIALKKQHRNDKMHTLYIIHPLIGLFQHLIWLMILWTLLLSWISHIKYLARCKLKEWHMAQLSSSMCAASLIILWSHVSDSCSLQQNQVQQSMTLMYFTWIKFNASFFARRNDNVLEALPWFRIITKETSMCGTTPTFLHQNEIEAHHQFCHSIFLQVARWIG